MEQNGQHNNRQEKSGSEILLEVLKLCGMLLLKLLKHILRIIIKLILWIVIIIEKGCKALKDFWNDNSTQEKVREIKQWTINAIKTTGQWIVIAAKATWKGIVWLSKATLRSIIHLKPTFIQLFRLIGKGLTRCKDATLSFFRKRKEAYKAFRKNKGFKGLLIDIRTSLSKQLNDYMEEEQNETTEETIGYEEYISHEIGNNNKTRKLGQRIYKGINSIVDDEDDHTQKRASNGN